MEDPIQEHADLIATKTLFEALFQSLEDASLRNKAYSEVIQTMPNQAAIMAQVQEREKTLTRLEPQKYSDLLNRAIHALEGRSLAELVPLGRAVQERVQHWGKP